MRCIGDLLNFSAILVIAAAVTKLLVQMEFGFLAVCDVGDLRSSPH